MSRTRSPTPLLTTPICSSRWALIPREACGIITLRIPTATSRSPARRPTGCRMPQTYDYYVDGQRGIYGDYPHNCQKMVEDAVEAADPYVDFSQYDNDGPGRHPGFRRRRRLRRRPLRGPRRPGLRADRRPQRHPLPRLEHLLRRLRWTGFTLRPTPPSPRTARSACSATSSATSWAAPISTITTTTPAGWATGR